MAKARHDIPIEPKAGKVGVTSVVLFGVLYITVAFAAWYMVFDGDFAYGAAAAIASIIVPMTVGFFVSEIVHQRAGAFWFVITAAVLTGGLAAWAIAENDDFQDRMDLIAPEATIPGFEAEPDPAP